MKKIYDLDSEKKEIDLYYLIPSIAAELYRISPNHEVKDIDVIMKNFRDKLRKDFNKIDILHTQYSKCFTKKQFYEYMKEVSLSIPEFVNLNLSFNEIEKGIKVDDPQRDSFRISSIYYSENSWKDDVMDLDAFIQNLTYAVFENI